MPPKPSTRRCARGEERKSLGLWYNQVLCTTAFSVSPASVYSHLWELNPKDALKSSRFIVCEPALRRGGLSCRYLPRRRFSHTPHTELGSVTLCGGGRVWKCQRDTVVGSARSLMSTFLHAGASGRTAGGTRSRTARVPERACSSVCLHLERRIRGCVAADSETWRACISLGPERRPPVASSAPSRA